MTNYEPHGRARAYGQPDDDGRYPPTGGGYPHQPDDDPYRRGAYPPPGALPYGQRPLDPREARAAAKAERARAKAMRPGYAKKRRWALGIIVVLIGIAAAVGGGDDGDDGADGDPAADQAGGARDVYAIGQTAHSGDFDVTVHGLEDPFTPSQFDVPPEGHRYVAVELTVANTSEQPLPFSVLAGVELFDQLDRPWTMAITGTDRPSIDAPTVAPGEARRGWVVFSLPPDATELTLRVKGSLTATGSLFALN